jgi:hypothetical protein
MVSPVDSTARNSSVQRIANLCEVWNRKLHFYIGLYLLFFVWLFAFTGLLLNHPNWAFAEFWPLRKESVIERSIQPPVAGPDLVRARNILGQLGLTGEIEWTSERANAQQFDFRTSRPGHMFDIKTNLENGRTVVHRIDVNAWGVLHILHTFTGVRAGDTRNQRDWSLTTLWALSMDAVAAGLLVMVFGSYYMWWRLRRKRAWGLLALCSGWVICAFFAAGLRLLT